MTSGDLATTIQTLGILVFFAFLAWITLRDR